MNITVGITLKGTDGADGFVGPASPEIMGRARFSHGNIVTMYKQNTEAKLSQATKKPSQAEAKAQFIATVGLLGEEIWSAMVKMISKERKEAIEVWLEEMGLEYILGQRKYLRKKRYEE